MRAGKRGRYYCKFLSLPLNLQERNCVSLLTVSDHNFANTQEISSAVVLCLEVDRSLKMWREVLRTFGLLTFLRG